MKTNHRSLKSCSSWGINKQLPLILNNIPKHNHAEVKMLHKTSEYLLKSLFHQSHRSRCLQSCHRGAFLICKSIFLLRSSLSTLDFPIVLDICQSNECCQKIIFMLAKRNDRLQLIMITNEKLIGLGLVKLEYTVEP